MSKIDWCNPPYSHAGRWHKDYTSILNPAGDKITWPQLIVEMVIFWRIKLLKDYKDIRLGQGWYLPIMKAVRDLNQQASVICNYFPHPNDEKLVEIAVKNYFRHSRALTIGRFRKVRSKFGRPTITQYEKDTILGIQRELDLLLEKKASLQQIPQETKKPVEKITFDTKTIQSTKRNSISNLLELEKQINVNSTKLQSS